MDKTSLIGISGGTFDPIHIGHLIVAQEVYDHFQLDKILFIPVGNPPHKEGSRVTPASRRMDMVRQAIRHNDKFEPLDIEVKRQDFTYAIDTLRELRELYPGAAFYYIIGADVVLDLLTWKDFEQVFQLCTFIAVLRPEVQKEKLLEEIRELKSRFGADIRLFEVPLIGISSTLIRKRIKEGRTVKYLLPSEIEKYVLQNDLYQESVSE